MFPEQGDVEHHAKDRREKTRHSYPGLHLFMVDYERCAVGVMADGACGCCCFHMLEVDGVWYDI
jgi:hypothetical protein